MRMLPAMFRWSGFEVEQVTGQDCDMVNLSTLISMFELFSLLDCSSSLGIGDVLVDTTQGLDKGTIGKVCSRAVTKGLEDMNLPSIPLRKSNFGLLWYVFKPFIPYLSFSCVWINITCYLDGFTLNHLLMIRMWITLCYLPHFDICLRHGYFDKQGFYLVG